MPSALRTLLAVLLALGPALAAAHQQVTLEPSAASRCLTSLRPGSEPEDGLARLVQEFAFTPDQRRIFSTQAEDRFTKEQIRMLQCIAHESGEARAGYPRDARRDAVQGRVLARLRFVAPDQPPQAEVYARPSASVLRKHIAGWVSGLRMPCHQGGPVTATWEYVFTFEGEAYGFKPLTLPQLLGVVRDIGQQTLAFDTTAMDCPFDLRLQYRQPFLPNAVNEVLERRPDGAPAIAVDMAAGSNPARRPLLDGLAEVDFDLPPRSLDSIFGDTALVTVPCVKIALKPKE